VHTVVYLQQNYTRTSKLNDAKAKAPFSLWAPWTQMGK